MLVHNLWKGYWQMHRYYIYYKYFVNKLTTLSLYQKSLINNSIMNKKCMYWFNYKIVIGSQRKQASLNQHYAYTKICTWYWFLCVKILWICQSPRQTIMLLGNKDNHYWSVFNFQHSSPKSLQPLLNIWSSIFRTP